MEDHSTLADLRFDFARMISKCGLSAIHPGSGEPTNPACWNKVHGRRGEGGGGHGVPLLPLVKPDKGTKTVKGRTPSPE
jgi:hypothetical protein